MDLMSMGGKCNNLIHAFVCISFILVFNPKIEASSKYTPTIIRSVNTSVTSTHAPTILGNRNTSVTSTHAPTILGNRNTSDIWYTLKSTIKVCWDAIDLKTHNCLHPAVKLRYYPVHSSTSSYKLIFNELFLPNKVKLRINTTEYGYRNITSQRNVTSLCIKFLDMSNLANDKLFRLQQICDITKVTKEKYHWFIFKLVPSTYPLTTNASTSVPSTYPLTTNASTSEPSSISTSKRPQGLECDGTRKSERIITKPLKCNYLLPGNQANFVWTWCIAVNSSVTGIVIFRSSRRNPEQISPVLEMDLSKNVYYQKDQSRHELISILNKKKFQEKTVFIINNVSKTDSAVYILCVKREGSRDLQSEVQVIVNTTDSTNELGFTSPITERTTPSLNNTILERNAESVVISQSWQLVLGIVLSTAFIAFVVLAIFLVIKRKKSSDGAREALFNERD